MLNQPVRGGVVLVGERGLGFDAVVHVDGRGALDGADELFDLGAEALDHAALEHEAVEVAGGGVVVEHGFVAAGGLDVHAGGELEPVALELVGEHPVEVEPGGGFVFGLGGDAGALEPGQEVVFFGEGKAGVAFGL